MHEFFRGQVLLGTNIYCKLFELFNLVPNIATWWDLVVSKYLLTHLTTNSDFGSFKPCIEYFYNNMKLQNVGNPCLHL